MTRLAQNKYNKLKYLTYFKAENEYCFLFRVGDSKVPIFIKKFNAEIDKIVKDPVHYCLI